MYYDMQRKLAFVMPPRTGTTTFGKLLKQWGLAHTETPHPKPTEVQIENLNQYTIYGFYRNPLDRFLSLFRYIRDGIIFSNIFYINCGISREQFKQMNYDQMLDMYPQYQPYAPKFFDPQILWLANANILDFNNYTIEILRVARMFDIAQVNVGIYNYTESKDETPSQRVIDYVQTTYADDYIFGHEQGLLKI